MALALLALSALGRLTSASVTSPQDVEVLSPRQSLADLSPVYDRSLAQIEKRALETFDLGWSARDEALFSAFVGISPHLIDALERVLTSELIETGLVGRVTSPLGSHHSRHP